MSFWISGYIMVCCNVKVAKKEMHRKSKPIEWLWSVIRSNTNAISNFRLSCLKKSSRSSGWRWTACSCKYPTKCIWMETIRIKPVPSVPGSFLLLARHLFLPNPAPINFFQAWIQLSQSKNSRVNAFLLPMHTLQTDIVEIFSRKALKKLSLLRSIPDALLLGNLGSLPKLPPFNPKY